MDFAIEKMHHANNERNQTTYDRRNGTTKSGKKLISQRKGILVSDTIKQVEMKEKI